MSFPERAESLRAKAHLSGVRLPVLVGVTALVVVVLVVAGGALINTLSTNSFSVQKEADQQDAEAASKAAESNQRTLVVHVGGAVVQPGVCELPEGARVQDAVHAAGGFADGAAHDALNLARILVDGEQVVVPTQQEVQEQASETPGVSSVSSTIGGKVNINTAAATDLEALPGIGPSTAEKIVADREAHGPFATIEDLKRVSGIGDKKYAALADTICVG